MPKRPPRYKPPRLRVREQESRPSATQRGYCSPTHKAWRKAVLLRDGFQCQSCKRLVHSSSELHADHIIPIQQGGARFDVSNGQALCRACHGVKTARESKRDSGRFAIASGSASESSVNTGVPPEGRGGSSLASKKCINPGRSPQQKFVRTKS